MNTKRCEFLLISGHFNKLLDAIDPQIKEIILAKHNQAKEVVPLQFELLDYQKKLLDLRSKYKELQDDLLYIYRNNPVPIIFQRNFNRRLKIVHNHINIQPDSLTI